MIKSEEKLTHTIQQNRTKFNSIYIKQYDLRYLNIKKL